MLTDQTIADVRAHTDIVAVVGEYVRLKRAGASFKGLCPFHNEKTPSFHVTPARQFFHCFGCGASGDAIGFVMKLDGLSFPEAVRRLAERAGVQLPEEDPREAAEERRAKQQRDRHVHAMEVAVDFYQRMLREHPLGHMAREELQRRGVTDETAAAFHLGYAPNGWDGLARDLADKSVSPVEAEAVGLIVPRKSGDGHYDRFRHRLMFPVHDDRGRFVAFSGRLLPTPPGEREPEEPGAKYMNSPETPLYKKGEILFGLWNGRVALRRTGVAILCEGNFDLVMLHQAGFQNSVAPMGTALTMQQAKILRRFVEKAVLLFDGDNAGKKAVRAAQPIVRDAGLAARVVTLPPGADPDSFLRERGADALAALIDRAPNLVEHLIEDAADAAAGDPTAKARAVAELGPVLAGVENEVERALYVDRLAQRLGITDRGALVRMLRQGASRGNERGPARGRGAQAPAEVTAPAPGLPALRPSAVQEAVLGALFDVPALLESPEGKAAEDLLTTGDLRAILQAARKTVSPSGIDGETFLALIPDSPYRGWIQERLTKVELEDAESAVKVLRDGVTRMRVDQARERLAATTREQLAAQKNGDDARFAELQGTVNELLASIREMQAGKR